MTTNYLYAAGGDAAWGQKSGAELTRSVGLPGGVSWTNQAGEMTWSFPGLGGHGLVTRTGATTGGLLLWDPFGQPVDPVTFAIGTTASDDTGQVAGNTLWHQGALKPAESAGSALVIEMGVRLYVPALGRFLQVDPIEGGGANDYSWPTDPINGHDLTGSEWDWGLTLEIGLTVLSVALLATGVGAPLAGAMLVARAATLAVRVAKVATDVVKAGQILVRASKHTRSVAGEARDMIASPRAAAWAGRLWSRGSRATERLSSHATRMRTGPSGRWVRGPGVSQAGRPKVNFGKNGVRQTFTSGWSERMAEDSLETTIQRIISEGAIGFVRRHNSDSFYARFETIPGDDGALVEITFNPEFVDLGGPDPTDVVVCWGDLVKVSAWLGDFLESLEVEWSPGHLRSQLDLVLFGAEAEQMTRFDLDNPWDLADTVIPPDA